MACFSQVIWHGGPNQRSSCQLWLTGSGLGISALDGWAVHPNTQIHTLAHTYKQFSVNLLIYMNHPNEQVRMNQTFQCRERERARIRGCRLLISSAKTDYATASLLL